LLPLAQSIWRFGYVDDKAHERVVSRKFPLKKDVCRRTFKSRDSERSHRKKVVVPSFRRQLAQKAVKERQVSIRLACGCWHQPDLLSLFIEAFDRECSDC